MALAATIRSTISTQLTSTLDKGTATTDEAHNDNGTLTTGTGANQANQQFTDTRTLTAGSNEELDLAGGLTNGLGATVTFARVVSIKVSAPSTNGSTISVFGAAANGFDTPIGAAGDLIKVRPGGFVHLYAPDATAYAVTAGTGDLLKILNDDGAASADYTISLIGSE